MTERDIVNEEILSYIPPNPYGQIHVAPRVGKTKIVIDLIRRDDYKKILWVTPSPVLAKTGIKEEFRKFEAEYYYTNRVLTTTWKSLPKIRGTYDLIVLDEQQKITPTNSHYLLVGLLNGNSILVMTGTPTKSPLKREIYRKLGLSKVYYKVSIGEANQKGLISDYKINVYQLHLNTEKNIEVKTKKGTYFKVSEKDNYNYWTSRFLEERNKGLSTKNTAFKRKRMIANCNTKTLFARKLLRMMKGKTIIFAGSIQQSKDICLYTYNSKTNTDYFDKFMADEIDKLCLVDAGGTGLTYKNINNVILVQAGNDQNGGITQKICRSLLKEGNKEVKINILCMKNTVDESWVEESLSSFDKKCIAFIDTKTISIR